VRTRCSQEGELVKILPVKQVSHFNFVPILLYVSSVFWRNFENYFVLKIVCDFVMILVTIKQETQTRRQKYNKSI
jgi:hypothetical protein